MVDAESGASHGFDPDEDLFSFDQHVEGELVQQVSGDLDAIFAQLDDGVSPKPAAAAPQPAASVPPSPQEAQRHATHPEQHGGKRPVAVSVGPAAARPAAGLSRSFLLMAAAVTLTNGLVAVVMLRSSAEVHESMQRELDGLSDAAWSLHEAPVQPAAREQLPLVAPDPEEHPTFTLVRDDIAQGAYARARQRLYSLLSVVDRLDPAEREGIEARANFLLAQALHLEVLTTATESR